MRCPSCGLDHDRVVDSRPSGDGDAIRRRRECGSCGQRFTTFERIERPELMVRKRNGTLLPFTRAKVHEGMARASKNRLPSEVLDAAVAQVENALYALPGHEVSSEQVGLEVLRQLWELDQVAYMRFASVYRDFQGTEDFEKELQQLRKDAPPKES